MKNESIKLSVFVGILFGAVLFSFAGTSSAQDSPPFECDDQFGECGTPQQSGGGCGCGGGGSILVNNTDLGDTYQYADDYDDDGHEDPYDNCPFVSNRDQADDDGDGVGTACDNCPNDGNEDQSDIDGDVMGDVCDNDMDGDNIDNVDDICAKNPDPLQKDTDKDGLGDACDADMDNDGIDNLVDNCPLVANPDQEGDGSAYGEACDADDDNDGVRNVGVGTIGDNCPSVSNPDQEDADEDGIGDACDPDIDGDELVNKVDNCPMKVNPEQTDLDRDKLGDECDPEYCYVVEGDVKNCLNPDNPFTVYSPMNTGAKTGEETRLRLFANRMNEPIRYEWRIVSAPKGSHASIDNPVGAVSQSTPYEYHYLTDQTAELIPDVPGEYKIEVYAQLVWEDELTGEQGAASKVTTIVKADGSAVSADGCSITAVGSEHVSLKMLLPMLLLVFGLLFARKRS